ncbi:MAG TPA: transglutaminaseTgpA domain-containing protein, partial [Chloroflexota bacterium]
RVHAGSGAHLPAEPVRISAESRDMIRPSVSRLLLVSLTAALFGVGADAAAGLVVPGSEMRIAIVCVTGVLIAVLWRQPAWGLYLLAPIISLAIALAAIHVLPPSAAPTAASSLIAPTRHASDTGRLFLLAFGVCYASIFCAWLLLRRSKPWPGVALAGLAVLVRADVSPAYETRFPWFVAAALVLIVLTYARSPARGRFVMPAMVMALMLPWFAWRIPSAPRTWSASISDPLKTMARGSSTTPDASRLTLSGAFHPSSRPVMSITLDRAVGTPYWRAITFDQYDGHSWTSTAQNVQTAEPWFPLGEPPADAGGIALASVRVYEATRHIISPGVAWRVDVPTIVSYGTGEQQPVDVESQTVLSAGDSYLVNGVALSSHITGPEELSPYLQLPPESPRLRTLAHHLAPAGTTPLKAALGILAYLHDSGHFTYDTRVGSPAGQDAAQSFLFTTHRGYCSQFATAMAVLARAAGIPARIVWGYTAGTERDGTFLVEERNAHSWTELYIRGRGWIAMEPTPGFRMSKPGLASGGTAYAPVSAALPRLPGRLGDARYRLRPPVLHGGPATRTRSSAPDDPSRIAELLAAAALLVLVATLLLSTLRPRSITQLYRRMLRTAHLAGLSIGPAETPLEFLSRCTRHSEYEDIVLLVTLYSRERYAGIAVSPDELQRARAAWKRVRRGWLVERSRFGHMRLLQSTDSSGGRRLTE